MGLKHKIYFVFLFLFVFHVPAFSQLGGRYVFNFLELPWSARSAALGGKITPVYDKDPSLAINNPSLLNKDMNGRFDVGITSYLAGIVYGSASYVYEAKEQLHFMGSLRYIGYGEFIKADETGKILGTFSAGEYALGISAGYEINEYWKAGMGINWVWSQYESYKSYGFSTDYALTYHNKDRLLTATFLINNLGAQLKSFGEEIAPLPLNIQVGVSKKPEHMPLRFIVIAHHLNIPDFTYIDPNKQTIQTFGNDNNTNEQKIPFSEKLFRHFIFAGELVLSENFHIRFGYNHQRRKEMQLSTRPGMVGYSFGFGLRINKFYLSYANDFYHVGGRSNHFTLTLNPSEFHFKRKKSGDE